MEHLPAINASLNALSFVLLLLGWRFIRRKNIAAHKRCMFSALASSALFLTCYLTYHYSHGQTEFTHEGLPRTIYFIILITHVPLATLMVPPIIFLLIRALRGEIDKHKRLARIVLPVWLYVSVTGVAIYFMLYQLYPPTR
ncbi:MAG: DUF420 domain-containing protein [Planctomycetota bacterium]